MSRGKTSRDHSKRLELVPLAEADTPAPNARRPLYVTSPRARLRLANRVLEVALPDAEPRRLPLRLLSHVVLIGRVRASLPLALSLSNEGVPVYFCHAGGKLRAVLDPRPPAWTTWLAQARLLEQEEKRVAFAREVVIARLQSCATLVVRFQWSGAEEVAREIRSLRDACVNKASLEGLRGLEGRGVRLFFEALRSSLDESWGFTGRKRRPPPDPVNSLLSFGYTVFRHHAATALAAVGLNPRLGIYHRPRGSHPALASDLLEEFRYLVEATVWAMIRRREVSPGDFRISPSSPRPCLMTGEFRKKYLNALERRLHTEITPEGESDARTYLELIARQATRIERLVSCEVGSYRPWRIDS